MHIAALSLAHLLSSPLSLISSYGGKAYGGAALVHSLVTLGAPLADAPGAAFRGVAWANREPPPASVRCLAVGATGTPGDRSGPLTEAGREGGGGGGGVDILLLLETRHGTRAMPPRHPHATCHRPQRSALASSEPSHGRRASHGYDTTRHSSSFRFVSFHDVAWRGHGVMRRGVVLYGVAWRGMPCRVTP